jgi:hypothetical protein
MKTEGGQTVKIILENPREVLFMQLAMRRELMRLEGADSWVGQSDIKAEFCKEVLDKMEEACT